jgi:tRNA (guanine37-N1)-methyltransferase
MKALALAVPLVEGELWRRRLREEGLLRTDLTIDIEGGSLYLPLKRAPADWGAGLRLKTHEFEAAPETAPESYRELVDLPAAERSRLPRAFDVVGEVVVIRLPPELEPVANRVGEALLQFVPGARVVAEDRGVHGPTRLRDLRRLAGVGGFETVHRENGLSFHVDLTRAYFSPRLAREHARVADQVGPAESIVDLCCGVGPFALTILHRRPAARAVAVDVNPSAIELVERNGRPWASGRLTALCSDVSEYLADAPRFDRAILNLPHEGARFLPALAPHLLPGSTLNFYEVVERSDASGRARELERLLGPPGVWSLVEEHVVHEFSPSSDLRGYSIKRSDGSAA